MKAFENEKDKNDNVNKNEENENSIQRKNDEIEESAKKLGIDSKNLEINENKNDNNKGISIDEKSKNLILDEESVEKNIGKVAEMSADKKVTQHYTAKKLIGGDYKRYIVTKNNGNTQMLGQKEDGTIEKVENVEQVSPHTATIAGPNGKLETKSIQAGFNIKNRENDSGFGLNNDQELTYERTMNADTPIGYEISEQMDKTKQAGYAQQLFDEINYKSTDMKDLADRKSEELRKEESPIGKTNPDIANGNPHVDEIESIAIPNQSNGIELLEIANKNNSDLLLVDLVIEYPKNSSGDLTKDTERIRESLGTISAGGIRSENMKVVIFGEQGSVRPIKISLEYRIDGSNSIFVKEKMYEVSISSAPINLLIEAPTEATPNIFPKTWSRSSRSKFKTNWIINFH
jgi:hypothetical protein